MSVSMAFAVACALVPVALPSAPLAPSAFVANAGQWDPAVDFAVVAGPLRAHVAGAGFAVQLFDAAAAGRRRAWNVAFDFAGAGAARAAAARPMPGRYHFFQGDDPAHWQSDVPGYAEVRWAGVQPGVDVVLCTDGGALTYDFVLAPGADLGAVAISCRGAERILIDEAGNLRIETPLGALVQTRPRAFAAAPGGTRRPLECRFVLRDAATIGFATSDVRPGEGLTVDPTLVYNAQFGGIGLEVPDAVAVDANGFAYVAGFTVVTTFPTTPGAFDTAHNGFDDAYVLKLSQDGTSLVYSTFIGGSQDDRATGIALSGLAASPVVTICGHSISTNYPTTAGVVQPSKDTGADLVLTRLTASGGGLTFSTYLGGSSGDFAEDIATDPSGNSFVVGSTVSNDFPTTAGAFDGTANGQDDAFVAKFNSSGTALFYATYLGGSSFDQEWSIALDSGATPSAHVAGRTQSANFPTTGAAFDTVIGGTSDAVVVRLNPPGTALTYSTFLGGTSSDTADALALDFGGNALVTGGTLSANFPVTAGVVDSTHNGNSDVYVAKLNGLGSALTFATFVGGAQIDQGHGIAAYVGNQVAVVGSTSSPDFPIALDTVDGTHGGGTDAFYLRLNSTATQLLASSYFGGALTDLANDVALDPAGQTYFTGTTDNNGFAATPGAFTTAVNGAFLAKLAPKVCAGAAANAVYGAGKPGTNGVPTLAAVNLPLVGQLSSIQLGNALPGAIPTLILGLAPASLAFDGGTLLAAPTILLSIPVPVPASGTLTIQGSIPNDAALCGLTLYHQILFVDPGAAGFYHTAQTNGLARTFGS